MGGHDVLPFCAHPPLSSECSFHDISPCSLCRWTPPFILCLYFYCTVGVLDSSSCRCFWHCISVFLSPLSMFSIMGGFTCWIYCFLGSVEWSTYSVFVPMYEADAVARHLCISVRWFIYYIDTHSFLFQWGFQQFLLTVFAASCFRDASCSFLFLSLGHFLDWRLCFLHLVLFLVLGTWSGLVAGTHFLAFIAVLG